MNGQAVRGVVRAVVRSVVFVVVVGAVVCGGLASGCATTSLTKVEQVDGLSAGIQRRPPPDGTAPTVQAPRFGDDDAYAWIDGKTGKQLSWDDVIGRLRASNIVVVGEQHDQKSHHEVQRRIVEVLAGDGPGLVVGMEMLTWEKQPELDRFNRGDIDAVGLRDAVDWKKAWGFDFALYQPILEAGHRGGAGFIALNAPRELVRAIRQKGVAGLDDDERALLPDLDLGDELHRAWFERIFSSAGHPLKAADVDGFYRAQVLWDESMADRAARALQGGARQVVVLAGAGHVANGRGIPQRVERRIGSAVVAVVPMPGVDSSNVEESIARAVSLGEGDILVIPRFEPEIQL